MRPIYLASLLLCACAITQTLEEPERCETFPESCGATSAPKKSTTTQMRKLNELVTEIPGHEDTTFTTYSPDGALLATRSYDSIAQIWDLTEGTLLFSTRDMPAYNNRRIYSVMFRHDGERALITREAGGGFSPEVAIDVFTRDGELLRTLTSKMQGRQAHNAIYSPDGTQIIVIGSALQVWDAATGRLLQVLQPTTDRNRQPRFTISPDASLAAYHYHDGVTHIWDIQQASLLLTIEAMEGSSSNPAGGFFSNPVFSPDNSMVALEVARGSQSGDIEVWSLTTKKMLFTLKANSRSLYNVTISPDNKRLLTTSGEGTVHLFSLLDGSLIAELVGHRKERGLEEVNKGAFSPDGTRIVTVGRDALAILWDGVTGKQLNILEGHPQWVMDASFHPSGAQIATSSTDGTVLLWHLK